MLNKLKAYWKTIDWEYTIYSILAAIVTGLLVFTTMSCVHGKTYREAAEICIPKYSKDKMESDVWESKGIEDKDWSEYNYWLGYYIGQVHGCMREVAD